MRGFPRKAWAMEFELELEEGRVNGIANLTLTPDVAAMLGSALGTILGEGAIVVTARDNYPPSRMLKRAFSAGLMSAGVTVIDFHAATTPELVFAIKRLGAKAGIQFTVSPLERNGVTIKMFDAQGIPYSRERVEDVAERAKAGRVVRSLPTSIGWVTYAEYIHDIYMAAAVNYVDVHTIAARGFRIVCDANFGSASEILPDLLAEAGVEGVLLNAHRPPLRGLASHMPSPRSLSTVREMVRASGAVLGAALCADATRVLLFDESGQPLLSEEVLSVLLLGVPAGTRLVVSEAMMSVVDKIAEKVGAKLMRVRGSMYDLARAARRTGSHIVASCGNEVAFMDFSASPDGVLTLLKVIELMAKRGEPLSGLRDELPELQLVRTSVRLDGADYLRVLSELKLRKGADAVVTLAGLRVKLGAHWVDVEAWPHGIEITAEATDGADEAVRELAESIRGIAREVKGA